MTDIAIIGGGPAGLAAGLYAARGGVSCALYEELFPGGQTARTERIENYPGFPQGVPGAELGANLLEQAERFGLRVEYAGVEKLELTGDIKRIHTSQGVAEARRVILAMGAQPRTLGLPDEGRYIGAGISYCAVCDGAFFRGQAVAVVGGGDTAVSDALYLARFAKKVYLIHRRGALRAAHALAAAAAANPVIEILYDTVITGYLGEGKLAGLALSDVKTGASRELPLSGLFMAVGVDPRSKLAEGQVDMENGYIITDMHMRTSVPGVYAAGDVRKTPLRQVVTAVADGAVAATTALESLA